MGGKGGASSTQTEADQMCGCSFTQNPGLPLELKGDISSVAHPVATHDAPQSVTELLQNQGSENLLSAVKSLRCVFRKEK